MTQRPALNMQRALDIKCTVCQQKFKYRLELIKHAQLNHPNDKVFKCDICSLTFANVISLLLHIRIHKFPSNRVSCKLCYKSFSHNHYLKLHLWRHAAERRYYCFVCETSYKCIDSLTKHKEIHLENHANDESTDLYCQIKEIESLQNFLDIKQKPNLNIDPLNTKTKHIDEKQVNSDTKICKNFTTEEYDQLEDNTSTNDSQHIQTPDDDNDNFILDANDDDDDNFILEKEPRRKTCRMSAVDSKCAICHKKFRCRLDLINHAQQNHPKAKCFKCTICSMAFVNYYSITRHRRIHKDTAKKHVCEYCSKSFLHRDTYKMHLTVHTKEKKYSCSLCHKSYKYKLSLNIHLKTHLQTENTVIKRVLSVETKCAVCQQEFEYRVDLLKHGRIEHPNDKVFKCSICPMVFKHISSLTNHRADHKNLPKKYMCKLCSKSFREKREFNQHIKTHSTKRCYNCSLCDKSFKYENYFKAHQKKHLKDLSENKTIKKFKPKKVRGTEKKCAICQQEFKYRFELVRHAQLNHPNDKAFKCGNCSMVFANVVSISRHSRVHKFSKMRFSCKICSKSFFRKDNLKRHLRTHTNERPYCFVCKTSFKCKDSLEKHLKIHFKGNTNEDTTDLDCQNNDNGNHNSEAVHLKDSSNINYTKPIEMSEDNDDDLILEENSNQPKRKKLRTISVVDTKCGVCHKEFKYRLELINHAKRNHPGAKVFKCSICSMGFSKYNAIPRHRRIHNDIGKEYVCEYCSKSFLNRFTYKRHMNVRTCKKEYTCSFCDKSYKQKLSFDNHLNTHLGKEKKRRRILKKERAIETKCAVCQQEFEYREDLIKHAQLEHSNDKVFKCSNCPMVFKHINSLTNHRTDHKNLPKKYICKLCPNSYRKKQKFILHMKVHSTEHKCTLCNKSYKYKNSLKNHQKIHSKVLSKNKNTGKRITANQRSIKIKCAVCQKEFKYRQDFIKHAQLVHSTDKVFKCGICPMVFKNISSLLNHQTDHKKLPTKYVCTFCPNSYRVKQKRDQHMKVHSTERCHACSLCDKSYKHKHLLEKHQKSHLKGVSENKEAKVKSSRRYPVKIQQAAEMKCAICQQKFKYSFELVKHAQQNHPNDKAFKCSNCSMAFVNVLSLSRHSEVHEDSQTKFLCEIRSKSYKRQDELKAHLRTHTNERKTTCTRTRSRTKEKRDCENKKPKSLQIPYIESQNILKIKSKLKISQKGDRLEDFYNTNASQQIKMVDDDDNMAEELNTDYISKQVENKEENMSRKDKNLENSIDDESLLEELTNPSNTKLVPETKCGMCHKEFYCHKDLIEHITQNHSNAKAFKCNICFKLFSNVYSLAKHGSLHKNVPEKHICSKAIVNSNEFTRHLKTHAKHSTHNDRRAADKRCGACRKKFQYRRDLVKHVNEYHPNTKAFKCNLCPMVFKNLDYISTHRRYTHKLKPKKYFCEICSCYLRDKNCYKIHLQSIKHKTSLKHHEDLSNEEVKSILSEIIISDDENEEIFLENHQKLLSKQKSNKGFKDHLRKTTSIICNDTHKEKQSLSNSVIKKELVMDFESDEVQDVTEITKTDFVYDEAIPNTAIRVDNIISDDENEEIFLENHQKLLLKQKSNKGFKDNLRKTIIYNDTHKENQSLSNSVIKKKLVMNFESDEDQDVIEITKTKFRTNNNTAIRVDYNCSTINDTTTMNKNISKELSNPHVCRLCLESFTCIMNLKIHSLTHIKEFPFLCSFCNRRFKSNDSLITHQTRIHSDHLSSLMKNVDDGTNNRMLNHEEMLEITNCSNDNTVMETIEDQFREKHSKGLNNQDNLINNEKPTSSVFMFQKDAEHLQNSNEIQCLNHTPYIEEEESYSDNVLETSKTKYIHNEIMNFEISDDSQSIKESTTTHSESSKDSWDKSIDVRVFQEEFLLHHFQNTEKEKDLANEPLCNVTTIYKMNKLAKDPNCEVDERIKCRQTVAKCNIGVERKCAVCQEEFNYRLDLIKHVQQYHRNVKAFKCSLCPMLFTDVKSIIRHRRRHEELPTAKAFPCCPETFNRMDYFMEHLKEHRKARHNCTQKILSFNEEDNEE